MRFAPGRMSIFGWVLLFCLSEDAQALDPKRPVTQYGIQSWADVNGLPQNSVHALEQTDDGYVWIGTDEGVARFDGVRFEVFNKSRVPQLKSNRIRFLKKDPQGALWIGTFNGWITRFGSDGWKAFGLEEGVRSARIRALHVSPRGVVYAADNVSVLRFENGMFKPVLEASNVGALMVDADDVLWVGTAHGIIRIQDGEKISEWSLATGMPAEDINALALAPDGTVWMGTSEKGVVSWDGKEFKVHLREDVDGTEVRTVYAEPNGAVWGGWSAGGVTRVVNGRTQVLNERHGIVRGSIRALLLDKEGSLWIGSAEYGLSHVKASRFWMYGGHEGIVDENMWAILEDREGAFWFGAGGGVSRMKDGFITRYGPADGLPAAADIWSFVEDTKGSIWIGSTGGLRRIREGHVETPIPELKQTIVFGLALDAQGTVWMGGTDGLYSWTDGQTTRHPYARSGPVPVRFRGVLPDPNRGGIWAATTDGLLHFDGQKYRRFSTSDGLASNVLNTVQLDAQGVLWIGTDGGLSRYDGKTFVSITARQGLFDDMVHTVLDDRLGGLWMSSNRGISRVDWSQIHAFVRGERSSVEHTWFRTADGMRSSECNSMGNSAGLVDRDGRLWFATIKGAAAVDPRTKVLNTLPPPTLIEDVVVNEVAVPLSSAAVLDPTTKNIRFKYTALSFVDPAKVRFRYMLEGADEHWVEAEGRREAHYMNLAPGRYRFRVVAANNDGVWNQTGADLSFERLPHFYETLWFKFLAAVVVLGAIFGVYGVRVRYLRQRQAELSIHNAELESALHAANESIRLKQEFVANISHELRTPLNAMINVPEGLVEQFEKLKAVRCLGCGSIFELEPGDRLDGDTACPQCRAQGSLQLEEATAFRGNAADARRHLQTLVRSGHQLLRLINDVLDFSKLESGKMTLHLEDITLHSFLEDLKVTVTPLVQNKRIHLVCPKVSEEVTIQADSVKLSQILVNLLGNAVKFTPQGGRIEVDAHRDGGHFVFSVKDNGPGIAIENHEVIFDSFRQLDGGQTRKLGGTGLGLAITRSLVELHKGMVWVESELGKGATFFVRLPYQAPLGAEPAQVTRTDARPPTVLVIDDDTQTAEMMRFATEGLKLEVVPLLDPRNYFSALKTIRPDLVVLDIMMPRMSGLSVLRQLRENEATKQLPVIVASAYHSNREAVASLGALWLPKPWSRRDIRHHIEKMLLRRQKAAG